jgi:hypothetical protein
MTTLTSAKTLSLQGPKGDVLGEVRIDEIIDGRVHGEFEPATGFAIYAPVFERFTEIVNEQVFVLLDKIESEIAQLGLWVRFDPSDTPQRVYDVQIFTDGGYGFSCRLLNP